MSTSSAFSVSDVDGSRAPSVAREPLTLRVVSSPSPSPSATRESVRARARPPRAPALRTTPRKPAEVPAEFRELLRDLSLDASSLERNRVPLEECTRAGDWVDVATGKAIVEQCDFELGTAARLTFARVWLSCSTYRGPLGHGWHHEYDVALAHAAESVAVRLPSGRVVWLSAPARGSFSYDADERLSLARDRYGFVLRDAAGVERRFVRHRARAAWVLGGIRTTAGCELRFGYDHRARLVHIARRGGVELELEYDGEDRIVEVCGPDPQYAGKRVALARFAYDARGNLSKASDPLGQARRYAYAGSLLAALTDRIGCSVHLEWDALDARARCVEVRVDSGLHVRRLDYQAGRTRVRNSLGAETTYAHDGALVFRAVDALGYVSEVARGPSGRLEVAVDALGQRRQRVYDARGNLIERCEPAGVKWAFEYDANDRTARAIDAMGGHWELERDRRGRLARLVDPLAQATCFHYRGRWLVGVTDANGHRTSFAYDDAGYLATCVAPDGATTRFAYDAWGQLVRVTDAQGGVQVREYDVIGRLLRIHEPDGNRRELAYDAEGNLTRWKDQQRDVRFTYQGTGRISSRSEAGHTVCFEYDSEEQLTAVIDEVGHAIRVRRDAVGAVVETVGFDGRVQRYQRDALGRITRIEREGQFSEYEYDAAGRVIEVQHSDGGFEGYGYRPDGGLASAWNESVAVAFERDALGRVIRERQGEHAVEYAYDAGGRLVELKSSLGARQVFEREAAGRVRRVAELVTGFESKVVRDTFGREVERSLPAGVHSAWQRDRLGRPSAYRLTTSGGEVLQQVVYEWDAGERLRRLTDKRRGVYDYYYDTRGSLAWVQSGAGRYQLRMPDATGNLFGREDRRDREYGAAGQLRKSTTRCGEVRYRYDAVGNRVERRVGAAAPQRYAWSVRGELKVVTVEDGEVKFGYDALGRRIWKKYRGQTTRWLWAGATVVHEWVEGQLQPSAASEVPGPDGRIPTLVMPQPGSREAGLEALLAQDDAVRGTKRAPVTWLWEPDARAPLAKLTSAGACAIVADHAGAPRWMIDAGGKVVWDAESSVTGELRTHEGERHACPARFAGMYEDLDTGLFYGGRYYDPEAGVYVSQGSTVDLPSLRPYAFVPELRIPDRKPLHPYCGRVPEPWSATWPAVFPAMLASVVPPHLAAISDRLVRGFDVTKEHRKLGVLVQPSELVARLVREAFGGPEERRLPHEALDVG